MKISHAYGLSTRIIVNGDVKMIITLVKKIVMNSFVK